MPSYFSGDVTLTDGRQYATGSNPVDSVPSAVNILDDFNNYVTGFPPTNKGIWGAAAGLSAGQVFGVNPNKSWGSNFGTSAIKYLLGGFSSPYLSVVINWQGELAGRLIEMYLNFQDTPVKVLSGYLFKVTEEGAGLFNCQLFYALEGVFTGLGEAKAVAIPSGARLICINRLGKLLFYKEVAGVLTLIVSATSYKVANQGTICLVSNSTEPQFTKVAAGEFVPAPSVPGVVRFFWDQKKGEYIEAPVFISNFNLTPPPGAIIALEELRIKSIIAMLTGHFKTAAEEEGAVKQAGGELATIFTGVQALVFRNVQQALSLPNAPGYVADGVHVPPPAQNWLSPGGKYITQPTLVGLSVMDAFEILPQFKVWGYKREVVTNAKGEETSSSIFQVFDQPQPSDIGKQYNPPIIIPDGVSLGFGVSFGELLTQLGTSIAMIEDWGLYLQVVASYRYKLYQVGEPMS